MEDHIKSKDDQVANQLSNYIMIDYSRPDNIYKPDKIIQMTTDECHEKNRALAFNRTTFRYIPHDD